jgi:hypothetical protein
MYPYDPDDPGYHFQRDFFFCEKFLLYVYVVLYFFFLFSIGRDIKYSDPYNPTKNIIGKHKSFIYGFKIVMGFRKD